MKNKNKLRQFNDDTAANSSEWIDHRKIFYSLMAQHPSIRLNGALLDKHKEILAVDLLIQRCLKLELNTYNYIESKMDWHKFNKKIQNLNIALYSKQTQPDFEMSQQPFEDSATIAPSIFVVEHLSKDSVLLLQKQSIWHFPESSGSKTSVSKFSLLFIDIELQKAKNKKDFNLLHIHDIQNIVKRTIFLFQMILKLTDYRCNLNQISEEFYEFPELKLLNSLGYCE